MNINHVIFKHSLIKTGLLKEKDLNETVKDFEDCDVPKNAHFLALQIQEPWAATPMEIDKEPQVQVTDKANSTMQSTLSDQKSRLRSLSPIGYRSFLTEIIFVNPKAVYKHAKSKITNFQSYWFAVSLNFSWFWAKCRKSPLILEFFQMTK